MADSKYKKTIQTRIKLNSAAPADFTPMVDTRIKIQKSSLFTELRLAVTVTQAFSVAPTSFDPRRIFASVVVEADDGKRINLDGWQAYDSGRCTESQPSPTITLGTSSSAFLTFDLHLENDGMEFDLMAAARYIEAVVLMANAAADSPFMGGTASGNPQISVDVVGIAHPGMSGRTDVARMSHFIEKLTTYSGTAASNSGEQPDFKLTGAANKSIRFLYLHAFSVSGGILTPSDGVITNVRVKQGEHNIEHIMSNYATLQKENVTNRGLNVPGLLVLDFGDKEDGLLDMSLGDVTLGFDVAATAPTNWRVNVAQDRIIVK